MKLQKAILESLKAVLEYNAEVTKRNYGKAVLDKIKADKMTLIQLGFTNEYTISTVTDYAAYVDMHADQILTTVITKLEELTKQDKLEAYIPFLLKIYTSRPRQPLANTDVITLVKQYDLLKQKNLLPAESRDVMKINTLGDMHAVVDENGYKLFIQKGNENAKTVYEDSEVRVVVPLDFAASNYYGQNTKWCTTGIEGESYFDGYTEKGPLYILLPKHPEHTGEKYQLHFETAMYTDETDKPIALGDILTKRFSSGVDTFFAETVDYAPDRINAVSTRVLRDIVYEIYELAKASIYESAIEMLSEDSDMREVAYELGYVTYDDDTETTSIDWLSFINGPEFTEATDSGNFPANEFIRDMKNGILSLESAYDFDYIYDDYADIYFDEDISKNEVFSLSHIPFYISINVVHDNIGWEGYAENVGSAIELIQVTYKIINGHVTNIEVK